MAENLYQECADALLTGSGFPKGPRELEGVEGIRQAVDAGVMTELTNELRQPEPTTFEPLESDQSPDRAATRARLEFDLPEAQLGLLQALHGGDVCQVLWDLDQELRTQLKYGDPNTEFKTADGALEWVRDQLRSLMDDRGVSWALLEG